MNRYDLSLLFSQPHSMRESILSVYLDVDQAKKENQNRGFEARLNALAATVQNSLSEAAERERFTTAMHRVKDFISAYRPIGSGLILFFDEADGTVWHQEVHFPLTDQIRWNRELYLQPLANALDQLESYGVVLLGRDNLRLFSISLGMIEEIPLSPNGRNNGFPAASMPRSRVVKEMDRLFKKRGLRRFILAGDPKITMELDSLLPRHLALTVIGETQLPMNATAADVLSATQPVAERYERDNEVAKVHNVVTSAAKDGKAVVGLGRTLKALNTGRVWELVYVGDFVAPGYECLKCSALFSTRAKRCTYCGSHLEPVKNVVGRAVEHALRKKAKVEVVTAVASETLRKAGGIGAFLKAQPQTERVKSSLT